MPRRPARRTRRPAAADPYDFDWILAPWDAFLAALSGTWRGLGSGLKSVLHSLRTRRSSQLFLVLFAFALLARLWRPDWYAHNTFHPDERWIFDKTAELSWPGEPGKSDAAGLQYGSLPFYVVAAAKDVAVHVSHIGAYDAAILWGRTLTGCVDALTVLGVFLLALELAGPFEALLAALIVACAPLHLQLSHFFTVDPWLTCFAVYTLAACVKLARAPGKGWSAACGVLFAAALASKSSGLPLVLPLLLAQFWPALAPGLDPRERKSRLLESALGLAVAAATTLAAFFVFEPWALLDYPKFMANQTAQSGIIVVGSPSGTPFVRQYWDTGAFFHLRNIALFYLGLPAGLLALLAVPCMAVVAGLGVARAWGVRLGRSAARPLSALHAGAAQLSRSGSRAALGLPSRSGSRAALALPSRPGTRGAASAAALSGASAQGAWQDLLGPCLLLAWVLPYFFVVGFFFAKFARYMLPALPELAVLLALFLSWLRLRAARLSAVLAGLTLLFALGHGSGYFLTYLHPHPWLETSAWTYAHVPATTADPSVPGGLRPTRVLNEDWGDDLPVSVNGHVNTYNNLKGQPGQVNIVEPDSQNKLDRLCTSLSQTDVIYLADPRAYATYLRIPHRYPLTNAYYTLLFSDPGRLGFKLAHESDNPIRLFGLFELPDSRTPQVPSWRWADESFTLYDRPHAFVFQRSAPMATDQVRQTLLDEVKALHLSDSFLRGKSPDDLQAEFDGTSPLSGAVTTPVAPAIQPGTINRNFGRDRGLLFPLGNAVLTWWFLVCVLGWLALPLTARLFKGFPAGGYALSKALGVFLFGWLAFNLALLLPNVAPFWQSRLWLLLALGAAGSAWGFRAHRRAAVAWIKGNQAEILFTEAVFAAAFLFFVGVRLFNPNIHDVVGQGYFGGGEPLGMTYLSAVSRCATFPAYDPWLTLANSSYYYFGYVLAATLTKLSGFQPAVTYNLSLALFFSLALLCSYGLLRGLVSRRWLALGGAAMVALAGSLWSVAYIALQMSRGVSPLWALFSHGFIWDPTRFPELVSGHIFEFPFFSYLYGDLHPHNIVIGFSVLLAALLLKPFLSREGGWRSFGDTPLNAALWLSVMALLLDAQYAINTWSWPIYVALAGACLLIGPWAGKGLPWAQALQAAAWGLAFFVVAVGFPCPWLLNGHLGLHLVPGLGQGLMAGFRHFFIQEGGNRVGRVLPGEWQMSAYIPLAYYLPGLLGLAALGGMRVHSAALGLAKPLGFDKLKRKDWLDKVLTLGERYYGVFPFSSLALTAALTLIAGLLLWASFRWQNQGVLALNLGLGLACFLLFLLGGFRKGPEAFLWILGGCFCFMVAGVEVWFVADRMNTIFKVWMNGWVFMGLVFGAGFASAFDAPAAAGAAASKPPASRSRAGSRTRVRVPRLDRRVSPQVAIAVLSALGLVAVVAVSAMVDAHLLAQNGRFIFSYLVFGALLLAALGAGAYYGGQDAWRWVRQGVFFGLLALGLLYPLGAVVERIVEASQFRHPHLDGLAFMAQRDARPGLGDKDYDKHDYALITWLNKNASVTETLVEAPGLELYKGFNRYAIYTGLPTLLGWDYQVSQQLGERTGGILEQRKRDASVIYGTDEAAAVSLLKQYHARWIVVGTLERRLYPPQGLDKFAHLATVAFQDGPAVLYRFDWDKP